MELSERRQLILKLVIQEYVKPTEPRPAADLRSDVREPRAVASETLMRLMHKYGLVISSATIRNELAALEDLGMLTHLHTSAGRIPTDAGYRYYIENLMDRTPLSLEEQRTIQHQFYQVRGELDQWIHLAAAVLVQSTQNIAVVTPPRANETRFKHLELIAIHDSVILMVLVLHDGTIKQQSLTLDHALSQDELSRIAGRLNDLFGGADSERIDVLREGTELSLTELEQTIIEAVTRAMRQREGQLNEQVHHDGLLELIKQEEFKNNAGRVREVLEILEGQAILAPLIPQALASNGVQVIIGGEHGLDKMRDYSVILSRYGRGGNVAGVVGLLGPTRMAYPRSISTVRYISTVMSELLAEMYGDKRSDE